MKKRKGVMPPCAERGAERATAPPLTRGEGCSQAQSQSGQRALLPVTKAEHQGQMIVMTRHPIPSAAGLFRSFPAIAAAVYVATGRFRMPIWYGSNGRRKQPTAAVEKRRNILKRFDCLRVRAITYGTVPRQPNQGATGLSDPLAGPFAGLIFSEVVRPSFGIVRSRKGGVA